MPIHEFKCLRGHVSEKLFLTFAEAEKIDYIVCPVCNHATRLARKIISTPGQAILYGDGFYKPAASGNTSTRRGDPSKAAKEVAQEMGAANIARAVKGKK